MVKKTIISVFILFQINLNHALHGVESINKKGYTKSQICGECHTEIYNFWKNSLHALSIDDPIFSTAYMQSLKSESEKAKKMCLRCHAPVVQYNNDYNLREDITKEGVNCDFCHTVRDVNINDFTFKIQPGEIKRGSLKSASSQVHKVEFSELFSRSEFCAGCHELKGIEGVTILGTYTEWKQGPYPEKGVQCQNCHMPKVEGWIVNAEQKKGDGSISLHDIQGGHSLTQLKKAVSIEITKVTKTEDSITAEIKLKNSGSGHYIPTGLPSRKLVLEVNLLIKDKIVDTRRIVYEKTVIDKDGKILNDDWEIMMHGAKILSDTRLKPMEERTESISFKMPAQYEGVITAKINYEYIPYILDRKEMKVEINSAEIRVPQ